MSGPVVNAGFVDALALPRLVRLRPNLVGLAFPLMTLRSNPDALVAVVLPDEGYRYQDTVYDDAWLDERGLRLGAPRRDPRIGTGSATAPTAGPAFRWGRRGYGEVVGAPAERLELVSP